MRKGGFISARPGRMTAGSGGFGKGKQAMKHFLKNLEYATVLPLAQQVDYLPGQVISKTLSQNKAFGLTLFALDKGEEISAHKSTGDALVIALDGVGEIQIDEDRHVLHAGECIVMPAGHPHAVRAPEQFKMFLVVVFPE